jgi:hypothetical protein
MIANALSELWHRPVSDLIQALLVSNRQTGRYRIREGLPAMRKLMLNQVKISALVVTISFG